jgi:hypothetical protein
MKSRNLFFSIVLLFVPFVCVADNSIDDGLPQVMIIGTQKSGTGAFYEILRQHPKIIDRPGEIHFFDIHFEKGIEWYKAQIHSQNDFKTIGIDKSPYYLFHPLAAERAHSILPKAKLIVLLRNPIDRAYSQYQMNVRKQREPLSFADAIKVETTRLLGEAENIIITGNTPQFSNHRHFSYLSRGIYIEQIKNWLNYFSCNQMLIISFEEFLQNPEKIIQEALAFIGLPEFHNFNFKVGKKNNYLPLDPSLREELSDYFRSYNEELEAFLNKSFNWD